MQAEAGRRRRSMQIAQRQTHVQRIRGQREALFGRERNGQARTCSPAASCRSVSVAVAEPTVATAHARCQPIPWMVCGLSTEIAIQQVVRAVPAELPMRDAIGEGNQRKARQPADVAGYDGIRRRPAQQRHHAECPADDGAAELRRQHQ